MPFDKQANFLKENILKLVTRPFNSWVAIFTKEYPTKNKCLLIRYVSSNLWNILFASIYGSREKENNKVLKLVLLFCLLKHNTNSCTGGACFLTFLLRNSG